MSVMADGAVAAEPGSGCVRLAAVFLPAPLPREGRVAFWDPADGPLPTTADAEHTELTVVRRRGSAIRRAQAPALSLPLDKALPLLVRARRDPAAHPATACWGAAALHALRLTARGRLLPGLTPTGHDAWRAGPLDPEDIAHLRAVAAALPHEGHAVPLPGSGPLLLPRPEALMRSFLDAVADTLPRTPAAPHACGKPFADHAAPAAARRARLGRGGRRSAWTRACGSRSASTCPPTTCSTGSTTASGRAGRAPRSSRCTASPTPP